MQKKYLLGEERIPRRWYNIVPDFPEPPAPALHPGTGQPAGPDDLAAFFPMGLIAQEASTERYIDIPDEIRDIYRIWRPTPLIRATGLEKALGLRDDQRIFFKYEGVSPSGSHKSNTAVAQAFYNQRSGRQASRHRDRRRSVGQRAVDGLPDLRPRPDRLHGQGQLPAEALPARADGAERRHRLPEPHRAHRDRPQGARGRPREPGQPRARHLRGGRGRHGPPRLQVRAGQRAQPRAAAPDGDRRGGHRAGRGGRRLPRRRDRLRRRRLELRRHRLPLHARGARRQGQDPVRRRRAHRLPLADQGRLHLRLRRRRPDHAAAQDVHARPRLHAGRHPRRRPSLPCHGTAHQPRLPSRPHGGGGGAPDQGLRGGPAVHAERGHRAGARVGARHPHGHQRGPRRQGRRASRRPSCSTSPVTASSTSAPTSSSSPASSRTTTTPKRPSRPPWSTCRPSDEAVGAEEGGGRGSAPRPLSGTIARRAGGQPRRPPLTLPTNADQDRGGHARPEALPRGLDRRLRPRGGFAARAATAHSRSPFRPSPPPSTVGRPRPTCRLWSGTSPAASPAPTPTAAPASGSPSSSPAMDSRPTSTPFRRRSPVGPSR